MERKQITDSKRTNQAMSSRRGFLSGSAAVAGAALSVTLPAMATESANTGKPPLNELFPDFQSRQIQTSGATINFVTGGKGPPLLLLHGAPQSLVMWHKVAPTLAKQFEIVAPDLRGYGDSSKPPSDENHTPYLKRAMALDQIEVMEALGHTAFLVAAHDRGARVAHRLALDHPKRVERLILIDILPTLKLYRETDMDFARTYWHWFFFIQPAPFPETLLGNSVDFFMQWLSKIGGPSTFTPAALAAYRRTFAEPDALHALCEDYRASASTDLKHDEADIKSLIQCPLHVLWGSRNPAYQRHDVISVWQERAEKKVSGQAIDSGHFIPEEAPQATINEITKFFAG